MKKYLFFTFTGLLILLIGVSLIFAASMEEGQPEWVKPAGWVCCLIGFILPAVSTFHPNSSVVHRKQDFRLLLAAALFVNAGCIRRVISYVTGQTHSWTQFAISCCIIVISILSIVHKLHALGKKED